MSLSPKVVAVKRIHLEELSLESDSGWRHADAERSQELVGLFEAGEYGRHSLAKPSVLSDSAWAGACSLVLALLLVFFSAGSDTLPTSSCTHGFYVI